MLVKLNMPGPKSTSIVPLNSPVEYILPLISIVIECGKEFPIPSILLAQIKLPLTSSF